MKLNYAIVFVSNMNRSIHFYRDILEMPLRFDSPAWTEFSTEGATLALHLSDSASVERPGEDLPAGQCRPGFSVADLGEFHQRMIDHSIECVQEPKMVFGARIAQYADPDGLAISVSEERRTGKGRDTSG